MHLPMMTPMIPPMIPPMIQHMRFREQKGNKCRNSNNVHLYKSTRNFIQ